MARYRTYGSGRAAYLGTMGERATEASQRETYRNTLQYAVVIAGSEFALATRIGVSVAQINIWLHGIAAMPDRAFFDAVDVIVNATAADIARTRSALAKRQA